MFGLVANAARNEFFALANSVNANTALFILSINSFKFKQCVTKSVAPLRHYRRCTNRSATRALDDIYVCIIFDEQLLDDIVIIKHRQFFLLIVQEFQMFL